MSGQVPFGWGHSAGMHFRTAFWIAEDCHVNPFCVFSLLNSVVLVPIFIKNFRGHPRKPAFVAFLFVWCVGHGLVVVALMRWTPITVWLFGISAELVVGCFVAGRIFGIRRTTNEKIG